MEGDAEGAHIRGDAEAARIRSPAEGARAQLCPVCARMHFTNSGVRVTSYAKHDHFCWASWSCQERSVCGAPKRVRVSAGACVPQHHCIPSGAWQALPAKPQKLHPACRKRSPHGACMPWDVAQDEHQLDFHTLRFQQDVLTLPKAQCVCPDLRTRKWGWNTQPPAGSPRPARSAPRARRAGPPYPRSPSRHCT